VAELRLIALFVAKWKLDPTQAKLMLSKLTPPRRRHVIMHFKAPGMPTEDSVKALEEFIAKCDAENSWPAAPAAVAPAATNGATAVAIGPRPAGAAVQPAGPLAGAAGLAAAGIKRTIGATALDAATKRPKAGLMLPTVGGVARPKAPAAIVPPGRVGLLQPRV